MANGSNFLDKFAEVSAKIGNQVHLRSLRDGFATIMPLFILAGIAALLNNVVFKGLWSTTRRASACSKRRPAGDRPVLGQRAPRRVRSPSRQSCSAAWLATACHQQALR